MGGLTGSCFGWPLAKGHRSELQLYLLFSFSFGHVFGAEKMKKKKFKSSSTVSGTMEWAQVGPTVGAHFNGWST